MIAAVPALRDKLLDQAKRFATTWIAHFPIAHRAGLEARTAALLPCLMLARVDGKSPVEYLTEPSRQIVRDKAIPLIGQPVPGSSVAIEPDRAERISGLASRTASAVVSSSTSFFFSSICRTHFLK